MSYQSPRWTGEIADCSLPVTLDTYSNCAFGCVYCFSQYQRGLGKSEADYYAKRVKYVDVEKIKKLFLGKLPPDSPKAQFWPYMSLICTSLTSIGIVQRDSTPIQQRQEPSFEV